jgi:hypothetical protein
MIVFPLCPRLRTRTQEAELFDSARIGSVRLLSTDRPLCVPWSAARAAVETS